MKKVLFLLTLTSFMIGAELPQICTQSRIQNNVLYTFTCAANSLYMVENYNGQYAVIKNTVSLNQYCKCKSNNDIIFEDVIKN